MSKLFEKIKETDSYLHIQKRTQELKISVELSPEFNRYKGFHNSGFSGLYALYAFMGACFSMGCTVVTKPLISHSFPLSQIERGVELMERKHALRVMIEP